MFGAIAGGIASALAGGAMSKLFGGGQKAASGGIQGDVLATDNNTVGMGDAGISTILKRRGCLTVPRLTLMSLIKMMLVMVSVAAISKTFGLLRFLLRLSFLAK